MPAEAGGTGPAGHGATAARRMGCTWIRTVKEISLLEVLARGAARAAAVSGVLALVLWITWVMLDLGHLQKGFTLP